MHPLLSRFFKSDHASVADGLDQNQREAIVDLLNFCRAADDRLVPAEEVVGAAEEATFMWTSSVPLVVYAADSLQRSTDVLHDPARRIGFLQNCADRLRTTEVKTKAVVFCQAMFLADGEFTTPERVVFREIKTALGWTV